MQQKRIVKHGLALSFCKKTEWDMLGSEVWHDRVKYRSVVIVAVGYLGRISNHPKEKKKRIYVVA